MLYTPMTKRALNLCLKAHKGQKDRSDLPYALHPIHLAEQFDHASQVCAALLHDTMEDCDISEDDLREAGMSEEVIEAVRLLTHDPNVPYLEYVRGTADNRIAKAVKIADLRHNGDLSRLERVTDQDRERVQKYYSARVLLGDMAYEVETPVGPFRVLVNGEPWPFAVRDASSAASAMAWQHKGTTPDKGIPAGQPDKTYDISVDVLPLRKGDVVETSFDFGQQVSWSSDEHVRGRTYVKEHDGVPYTLGLGALDDEAFNWVDGVPVRKGWGDYPFRLVDSDGRYEIFEEPLEHMDHAYQRSIRYRVCWSEGANDRMAYIVGNVAMGML